MDNQVKREKVISGIQHEMDYGRGKCGHYCSEGKETVFCEYDKNGLCIQHWGNDALILLKKQEPIKPLKMAVNHIRKEPVVFSHECPVCMCGLQRHWVACPICGQAVKWI